MNAKTVRSKPRRTKRTTAKTISATESQPKTATEGLSPPAPIPHPMAPTEDGTTYRDGAPRADLTDLAILAEMFSAPNAPGLRDPSAAFLSAVLLSTSDEIDAATSMDNGLDNTHTIDRIAYRARQRASFAVEIVRRIEERAEGKAV